MNLCQQTVPETAENSPAEFTLVELFAGGGMARAGLNAASSNWRTILANDFDAHKCAAYRDNYGDGVILLADIAAVIAANLPGAPEAPSLVWASSPCQDLSGAGKGQGFTAERSGTVWQALRIIRELQDAGRAPKLIVWENVQGSLSLKHSAGLNMLIETLAAMGYAVGGVMIDAALFLPQSRPRVFIVAARKDLPAIEMLSKTTPSPVFHPRALIDAQKRLSEACRKAWRWWKLPMPPKMTKSLSEILQGDCEDEVKWDDEVFTSSMLRGMSDIHSAKVELARRYTGQQRVLAVYRRTRNGVPRWEVRDDGLAGALRTSGGGSSVQRVLVVNGNEMRSRKLTPRETARLMGLSDKYKLPTSEKHARNLTGDGVCVPVVEHLTRYLIEPLLD